MTTATLDAPWRGAVPGNERARHWTRSPQPRRQHRNQPCSISNAHATLASMDALQSTPGQADAPRNAAVSRTGGMRCSAEELEAIGALIAGDRGAWGRFVRSYARVIYAAVQRRLLPAGRGDEVEDVAQDVFVKLCKSDFKLLRGYDPARAKLTTWLTVIATSASIDHLRRRRAATLGLDDVPEASLATEDPAFERIQVPPGLLSARQALVLELLYKKDLDVAGAAHIMNVDPQTVRSTHHKALTKLRGYFQEEDGDEAGRVPGDGPADMISVL